MSRSGPITVLMSPIEGRNPYARLLAESLPADVVAQEFTWRRAFGRAFDVVHVHWPERLFSSRSISRQLVTGIRLLLFLVLLRVRRVPLVWTVHEEIPHGSLTPLDATLVRLFCRSVDRTVVLSLAQAQQHAESNHPVDLVPHGHFRPVVGPFLVDAPRRGFDGVPLLVSFGLIRPYKGFDMLIRVAADLSVPCRIVIVGPPADEAYVAELVALAEEVPAVDLRFWDHSERELAQLVASADGVVLPYRSIQNSGAVLYALSCGTPALVTGSPAVRELADEVGNGEWVTVLQGPVRAADLDTFLARLATTMERAAPAMESRDWRLVGEAQARCYRAALET